MWKGIMFSSFLKDDRWVRKDIVRILGFCYNLLESLRELGGLDLI